MRRTALILLLVAAAAAPALPQDSTLRNGESEHAWKGVLPDPSPYDHETVPEFLGTRILDAITLKPVEGAVFLRYPEWERRYRTRHSPLTGRGVADANGFAHVRSHAWAGDSHWVVKAPGYAPAYEYDEWPLAQVLMQRGTDMTFRIVDGLGRPAAGARVEVIPGCGHSPWIRRTVADAEGMVTLMDVDSWVGQLWVEHPGSEADYISLRTVASRGHRLADLVLPMGWVAEGRVLDLAGDPLEEIVVRSFQSHKGPATTTDADGRFRLIGVEPRHELSFFHHGVEDDSPVPFWDWWLDGHPMTVRLGTQGIPFEPDDPGEGGFLLLLRGVDESGAPAGEVEMFVTNLEDGTTYEAYIEEPDAEEEAQPPVAETVLELRPGRYRFAPMELFAERSFAPFEMDIAANSDPVLVKTHVQPKLKIEGNLPEDSDWVLAVPGAQEYGQDFPDLADLGVPAQGDLALQVHIDDGPVFLFPVGPAEDGVRTVHVEIEKPRVLHLPPEADDVELSDRGWPCDLQEADEDGVFRTWATGPLTLTFELDDGLWEVPVRVPEKGGGIVMVDHRRDGRRLDDGPESLITATMADGSPPGSLSYEVRHDQVTLSSSTSDGRIDTYAGGVAQLELTGHRHVTLGPISRGETRVVYGPCALELVVEEPFGDAVPSVVFIDGEVYRTDDKGRLVVRGFNPGKHRLIVSPLDEEEGGRELLLILSEKDTLRRRVVVVHQEEDDEDE